MAFVQDNGVHGGDNGEPSVHNGHNGGRDTVGVTCCGFDSRLVGNFLDLLDIVYHSDFQRQTM